MATHIDLEADRVFPCTLSTLQDAVLGAKAYLASEDGTCEIAPKSKGIVFRVTPWGGATSYYLVDRSRFREAIEAMAEAGLLSGQFNLM